MIRGLPHRCTHWTPAFPGPDAYNQPNPGGFAVAATGVRCRLSNAEGDGPSLLLPADRAVQAGDRLGDVVTPAGLTVDAGPFSVEAVQPVVGRARVAYQRCALRRLTSIDQG